jgi:uncharacterized membrane protein
MKRFSIPRIFLTGVLAILPLVVTVAVVIWVAGFLGELVGPNAWLGGLLQDVGLRLAGSKAFAYLTGWFVVLSIIFGVGLLVEFGAKRLLQDGIDNLAKRIPLLGGVYGTVRQFASMMDRKPDADVRGMSVVFCVFGADTGAAFLALLASPERIPIGEVDYHAVLIPSAPVPVGGSLIFVPADSVRPANISVDAFMSIYVSMGVTGPQFLMGKSGSRVADSTKATPPTSVTQEDQPPREEHGQ